MKREDRELRAVERYKIIAPLLSDSLDHNEAVQMRKAIAAANELDERTLRRWMNDYRQNGLQGLYPAVRKDAGSRVITDQVLQEAVRLRKEVPQRSVKTLIQIMELDGIVEKGTIKRSTLQDALTEAGFSRHQMRTYASEQGSHYARRFQKEHRNECWQCDIKYGPYVNGERTYLFTVIDDATRYICHSEFFSKQDLEATMTVMRSAFLNAGVPKILYLDNGKVFRSKQTEKMAARLNIRLTYIKPYTPASHGKIERFNQTVDGFIREVVLEQPKNLEHLNKLYMVWLDACCQNNPHAGISGRTPADAFASDKEPLRFASEEELYHAFLITETRKVDKSGCISLNNEKWEIENGSLMIGRTVDVLIDQAVPEEVIIECEGLPPCKAAKLVILPHTAGRPRLEKPPAAPDGSRLLRGLTKQRQHDEEEHKAYALRFSDMHREGE